MIHFLGRVQSFHQILPEGSSLGAVWDSVLRSSVRHQSHPHPSSDFRLGVANGGPGEGEAGGGRGQ